MSANGHDYTPVPGKIPGTALNLGGHEFIMPALNLDAYQSVEENIKKIGDVGDLSKELANAIPIVHAALLRNYPEITVEDVRGLMDFGNVSACLAAVVKVNELKQGKPGEPPRPASP
jgi:hypothetical protein